MHIVHIQWQEWRSQLKLLNIYNIAIKSTCNFRLTYKYIYIYAHIKWMQLGNIKQLDKPTHASCILYIILSDPKKGE